MTLAPPTIEAIRAELSAAHHGDRAASVRRLCGIYGVSAATIYRVAEVGGARRTRALAHPEYRDWTRVAVALAHRAPRPIPLDLALRAAINGGLLPQEASAMPVSTARRIARELGLTERPKRTHRLAADYPMQAVLIDASTSEHLIAERPDGEDWLLRLHRRPWSAGGYKNKPLGGHRMRVMVYSIWDMCTGSALARYGIERGESALGAMEFLCWALSDKANQRQVMHGVPTDLWSDLGPLSRSDAARDLINRLGIELVTSAPYAKERMGGVERSHRTRWSRFERSLFLRKAETITLRELNARLDEFGIEEDNRRQARVLVDGKQVSRSAAWVTLTQRRETPLRKLPDRPMETMAREARRKIDRNGIIRWGGAEYEAGGGWYDRWVIARRAIDDTGGLTIEDEATGAKQVAARYEPRSYGDIRSSAPSALEQLIDAGVPRIDADIWAPGGAGADAEPENLIRFPVRTSVAAAPLENPLDTDRLGGMPEAMRVFAELYPWPLSAENRALVVARIEEAGLSRQAVIELAQSLTALAAAN